MLAVPAELLGLRIVLQDSPAGTVDQPHDVLRRGVRPDEFRKAQGLQGAEGLVIQADTAGVIDQAVAGFKYGHGVSVHAKDVGQRQP